MYINSYLKCDKRIQFGKLIPKISAKIGILRSLRKNCTHRYSKILYNAIVLPYFDYSDIVYDTARETNKAKLHLLQTRVFNMANSFQKSLLR